MERRFTRTSIAVAALVSAALVVIGPLHLVVEHHTWCAEHQQMVRAHDEEAHALGPGVHGNGDESHPPDHSTPPGLPPGGSSAPHDHSEDGCAWALLLHAPGTLAAPAVLAAAPALALPTPPAPAYAPVIRPIPLLRLAPSHSPPALSV